MLDTGAGNAVNATKCKRSPARCSNVMLVRDGLGGRDPRLLYFYQGLLRVFASQERDQNKAPLASAARCAQRERSFNKILYLFKRCESDRFGYGSGSATGQGIRPFPNSPPQPSNIYPSGVPVMAAPVYNFYGPTNNFFGPIYNYGQVGNVQNQANPDLNRRLDPWHGYNRNNGLENGY